MKSNGIYSTATVAAALTVILLFFFPWVRAESRAQSGFSKLFGSKEEINLFVASGFDIPRLANGKDARMAEQIATLIAPDTKNAHRKSYLVWLLPGLAAIMALLANAAARNKWLALGIGAVSSAVVSAVATKLLTTNLKGLLVTFHITFWFKLMVATYFVIGLMNLLLFARLHFGETSDRSD